MTFGGVTTVLTGGKDALKLLEEAGRVREKQPVVCGLLPAQGVHLKIDLQEVGGLETKPSEQEKGQIKGIFSSYSEQDLIQKFF